MKEIVSHRCLNDVFTSVMANSAARKTRGLAWLDGVKKQNTAFTEAQAGRLSLPAIKKCLPLGCLNSTASGVLEIEPSAKPGVFQNIQVTSVAAGVSWPQTRQNAPTSVTTKETSSQLLKHVATSPGTRSDIIQKRGVFQRTVLACVPFLRVKTQNDSMAQEQRSPHQNVPYWPFPTIIDNEVESHPKEHEEHEKDWIEIAQTDGQGVLMHNGRQGEDC